MMIEKKIKIAIIGMRGIPANYGGFETCAEETAVRLVKDFDVFVFCRKHINQFPGDVYKGVRLIKLPSIRTKSLDTMTHTLLCVLYLTFTPSIKIVHLYNAANAIFLPWLRLFGKKVYVSVDGLEWRRTKWGRLARTYYKFTATFLSAKFANKVIADSRVVEKYYWDQFKLKTVYIPYGANIDSSLDESVLAKYGLAKRRYLFFVGRLVPEKGVHHLIDAYNQLKTDMPLVIIGDDVAYRDYVAELKAGASANVKFLGYLYGREYQAISAFPYFYVSASQLEGTSPSLVTAMAFGNCVLVNGIEENKETIGEAGLVFAENNWADLQNRMQELIDNPQIVASFREKAAAHARDHYDWDAIARKYQALFTSGDV
jgi:glycosyltransferase involved in cell wall biosynthesis